MSALVSVIIPTFRRPVYLRRAIMSILSQSYSNIEVLVVDDNNDGDEYRLETECVMSKFAGNSKVVYLKHEKNLSGAAARNTGLKHARGEYIAFLDDDDISLRYRIEKSVEYLSASSNDVGGVCIGYTKRYKNTYYKFFCSDGILDSFYPILTNQLDLAAGSTLLFRKEVLDKIGLFDESFRRHQDWDFLIRFLSSFNIVMIPDYQVVIHADGWRNDPKPESLQEINKHLFNVYKEHISSLPNELQKKIFQEQNKEVIFNYIKALDFKKASKLRKNEKVELTLSFFIYGMYNFFTGIFPPMQLLVYKLFHIKYYKERAVVEKYYTEYE